MKNITGQIEYIKFTKQAPILLLPWLALYGSLGEKPIQGLGRYAKILTVGPTQASGTVIILPRPCFTCISCTVSRGYHVDIMWISRGVSRGVSRVRVGVDPEPAGAG